MNKSKDAGTRGRGDKGTRRHGDRLPVTPSRRHRVSPSQGLAPPLKRLGQHFLIDTRVVDRIIQALQPRSDETILEIGPGRGALTQRLVEAGASVVAIEFDNRLIQPLQERFGGSVNLRLVHADALNTQFCEEIFPAKRARLVANLPYNISTAILQRLIEQRRCLTEMVLMLQREVVDRITAAPGSKDRGYLSVLVEAYCETERLFDVAPGAFRPPPKVWSSVIHLAVRPRPSVTVKDESLLWRVVSSGFAQRRKTILNNLRSAPEELREVIKRHGGASIVLCTANVDVQRRAETLALDEWARITKALE